ncbi:MAG: helix-turn-helix domain-containing protein [Enterococcus faecium]|nr:helix-turn-helix domain-containing protein [Enterococcus faecium]
MDFYSLLEKTTRLQITILDTIYHSNKIWSIEQLAEFTACDKRSIQNYCEQVRTLSISDQFRKEGRNYLFLGTNSDFQELILSILKRSPIFHLLKNLCLDSKVTIAEFSEDNNISESILRRHITRINQILKKYQLQIKTKKGEMYFKGSEMQIRYLIYLILWPSYRSVEWPFASIEFHQLFSEVEDSFAIVHQKPNKIKMIEWSFILAVTYLRSQQGHVIPAKELPDFSLDLWNGFEKMAEELTTNYKRMRFSLTDSMFLFLWMQSRAAFYLKEDYLQTALRIHTKIATPVKQLQTSFYSYSHSNRFKSAQIHSKKSLLNSTLLANGMHGLLFPQFSIVKHEITSFIEMSYPAFHREINRLTEQFKNESEELDWLHSWNLAEAFMLIISPTYFNKEIKIKFESDLPIGLELAYMEILQEQLSMYLNVVFTNDLLFKPELIIRTTDTSLKTVTYEEDVPCLTISYEMSSEQIYLLSQEIKKLLE